MRVTFNQFFPPGPNLTKSNLLTQDGKVFIITGGASGIGFELASILYQAGAKVYIAGRSEQKAKDSRTKIKSHPKNLTSQKIGMLEYLPLDLNDLSSIKASGELFMSTESKLDVLWNNAGISLPPLGSKSEQGYELQMATNCLGPFLLTRLLLPHLNSAVQTATKGTEIMSEVADPPADQQRNYLITKIGNWLLANELAQQVGQAGIISVSQNPGNLNTQLMRHEMWMKYASYPLLHHAERGAYTELLAGLLTELKMANNGEYVIPWGRVHPAPNQELLKEMGRKESGDKRVAKQFWDWCENKTVMYM